NIKVDYLLAKSRARQLGFFKQACRIGQTGGQTRKFWIDVGVACVFITAVELFFNPGHAGGEHGRKCQIGVGIRTRHAVLDPKRVFLTDDAKTDGAVIESPGHSGWRPTSWLITFVTVDCRSEEQTKFGRIFYQAAQKMAEDGRLLRAA